MTIARAAKETVRFVDEYAALYEDLFPDVRSFEQFKYLLAGMLTDVKRKSLPAIAKAVGTDPQALHHFLTNAPWSVTALRTRRLDLLHRAIGERSFTLCIDETGDKKKGHTTDYVAHQYIGNLGKLENGIVSVNAYGVLDQMTFPLQFSVYQPRTRLKSDDDYQTKPALAIALIQELQRQGWHFSVVLADSLYGESGDFITALEQLHLHYVVAVRSNHGVWLPKGARVRFTRWRPFERVFSSGTSQTRYLREVIYGQRTRIRYYQITVDKDLTPSDGTWSIMTNLAGDIRQTVGNTYGLRTWIEYGFKQAKSELGWADYRVTDAAAIERWWEIVLCAYLLVSLQSPVMHTAEPPASNPTTFSQRFTEHRWWDKGTGWKNLLNNLRLILQPLFMSCLLFPWSLVFDIPGLRTGFKQLLAYMNRFPASLPI